MVEWLVLVLFEAALEMQGQCVDGILFVAGELFDVRKESNSQASG